MWDLHRHGVSRARGVGTLLTAQNESSLCLSRASVTHSSFLRTGAFFQKLGAFQCNDIILPPFDHYQSNALPLCFFTVITRYFPPSHFNFTHSSYISCQLNKHLQYHPKVKTYSFFISILFPHLE